MFIIKVSNYSLEQILYYSTLRFKVIWTTPKKFSSSQLEKQLAIRTDRLIFYYFLAIQD
jgi:hypothetical protein